MLQRYEVEIGSGCTLSFGPRDNTASYFDLPRVQHKDIIKLHPAKTEQIQTMIKKTKGAFQNV